MSTASIPSTIQPEPELYGQTVVVIGGSAGIGLETARQARAKGARIILTARTPDRLNRAASELDALSTAVFDAEDSNALDKFFQNLPQIDHVMLTAGRPIYGRMLDMDIEQARRSLDSHLLLMLQVARNAAHKVRPGGAVLFMGGTGARRPGLGVGLTSAVTAAMPALTANLRSSWHRFGSTSLPLVLLTHHCPRNCSAMNSRTGASSFAKSSPSVASSDRLMRPR